MSWRRTAYRVVRPLLFAIDAESIHHGSLRALSVASRSAIGRSLCGLVSGVSPADAARAPVKLMGLRFRNRIGLGAGFDKDGVAIRGWAALGFGFVELGTVTPRPQAGNPRPRLFRLGEDDALINRMGFNNAGADALARRIGDARPHLPDGFVIGVNIGRNRETPDEASIADYVAAASSVSAVADYLAINVSSPNTPGLRDLQEAERLAALIDAIGAVAGGVPILVKLAPDLVPSRLDALVTLLPDTVARGVILSNTTTDRAGLHSARSAEPGGLSGRPLCDRTRAAVGRCRDLAGSRLTIVASGGIGSESAAIPAGADLAQLWTAMVYAGPGLIGETVRA